MSSRAQRQSTAVWLLAEALAGANEAPEMEPLRRAVGRLRPHVMSVYDLAMKRVQRGLVDFINSALAADDASELDQEQIQSYLHMLAALIGDQWRQCPDRPPDRKRNWRRLNNAVADVLVARDETGDLGVERGCEWAEAVNKILLSA